MGLGDRLRGRHNKKVPANEDDAAEQANTNLNPAGLGGGEGVSTVEAADEEINPDAEGALEVQQDSGQPEEDEIDGGLFSSIFGEMEEEDASPLSILIASLPEVSSDELLDDLEEMKELMRQWYLA